jgi:hypothetical protein
MPLANVQAENMPEGTDSGRGQLEVEHAVSEDRLSKYRGGTEIASSIVSDGTVENTSATNVATGTNSITEGSFANASGFPTVIQNSGANVLIQSSTVVNVQFK